MFLLHLCILEISLLCVGGSGPCSGLSCLIGCSQPIPHPKQYIQPTRHARTYNIGDLISYQCLPFCTFTSGSPQSRCQSDGKWQKPTLKCTCSCGRPPPSNHATHDGGSHGFNVGSQVTYRCEEGKKNLRIKPAKMKCIYDGIPKWDGDLEPIICQAVSCPYLHDPIYGYIRDKGNARGTTVTYMCNRGYTFIGDRHRTCQNNGVWTGRTGECKAMDCGKPGILAIQCDTTGGTTYLHRVKCRCDPHGGPSFFELTCSFRGKWMPDVGRKCQKIGYGGKIRGGKNASQFPMKSGGTQLITISYENGTTSNIREAKNSTFIGQEAGSHVNKDSSDESTAVKPRPGLVTGLTTTFIVLITTCTCSIMGCG